MKATLSLMAIYEYQPDIFDDFTVPQGLDRDAIINYIVYSCGEQELLYPQPDYLKTAIKAWTMARSYAWNRIWAALSADYNPIENYNRTETWTNSETAETNYTRANNRAAHTTTGGEYTDDVNGNISKGTDDTKIHSSTAFNSDTYKDNYKDTDTMTGTETQTQHATGNNNIDTHVTDETNITDHDKKDRTGGREGNAHGNIGVTTNQRMIEAELELRKKSFTLIITGEFKDEFILQIY